MRFLGIDTSNYTTSAAIVENSSVICNVKKLLEVKDGERGLRQSDALFQHIKELPSILNVIGAQDLKAVGVSVRPRDVEGSYMPCFLAGKAAAAAIASVSGIPCYEYSHQAGHIMAALYSCKRTDLIDSRFIAFHVSGGTTELLFVDRMKVEKIGGTLDISAGQLIDRVGVKLGFGFPCGRKLEEISASFGEVDCVSHVRGLECNLSGAENAAIRLIDENESPSIVAAFTLKTVCRTLDRLTENALKEYGGLPVVYAGGVMSNAQIKRELCKKYDAYFAAPDFSCDNAAGIALLAEREFERSK